MGPITEAYLEAVAEFQGEAMDITGVLIDETGYRNAVGCYAWRNQEAYRDLTIW